MLIILLLLNIKNIKYINIKYLIKKFNPNYSIIKIRDCVRFKLKSSSPRKYYKDNVLAFGDLLHKVHPLAGQGVNLGFSDSKELNFQLLTNSDKVLGDFSVLRKYARARRLDNELMAKTMTGLDWIYKENNEPLRWLRGFGMNLIDDSPMIKSFFQKQALGKSIK